MNIFITVQDILEFKRYKIYVKNVIIIFIICYLRHFDEVVYYNFY